VIDTPEYYKKWSSNARGHRNKILKEIDAGIITINTEASLEDFLEVYKKTRVRHKWKRYNIWRQKYLSRYNSANIRIYTASLDGVVLAGAVFLDYKPTSTYLIAFQDDRAKKHHLGLALLDRWYLESQKLGYQYLDLDHMRDTLDPLSYA
jgi:lipid II:glycine glycyltransferase (peptidoglycan interpeptide bridge formation enzyme)